MEVDLDVITTDVTELISDLFFILSTGCHIIFINIRPGSLKILTLPFLAFRFLHEDYICIVC